MSFKAFTWPVNPHTYREEALRKPQYNKTTDVFSGMGPVKRVITGEGAFFGIHAATQFAALAALLNEATPGPLVHPEFGSRTVFFTALDMTQTSRKDHISYRFTFTEADAQGGIPA